MSIVNSIWLWGLTGLVIPVVIHLLSRRESKVIPVGSIRHLKESATAQFRSVRLNEYLLLFLRCLLLTLLVLLIAGVSGDFEKEKRYWVVVEKGVGNSKHIKQLIDSLTARGFEARTLSEGFPSIEDSAKAAKIRSYWELAEQLQAEDLDSVVVLSNNYLKYFSGKRIPGNQIRWISFDPTTKRVGVDSTQFSDSLFIRNGIFSGERTSFQTEISTLSEETKATIKRSDTITISLVSDDRTKMEHQVILASLRAIQSITPVPISIKEVNPTSFKANKSNWVIWLSAQSVSPQEDSKVIALSHCDSQLLPILIQSPAFECSANGRSDWIITKPLNEESALEKKLTEALAMLILPDKHNIVQQHDRRSIQNASAWSNLVSDSVGMKKSEKDRNIDGVIFLLMALTLIAERWISYRRKQ